MDIGKFTLAVIGILAIAMPAGMLIDRWKIQQKPFHIQAGAMAILVSYLLITGFVLIYVIFS